MKNRKLNLSRLVGKTDGVTSQPTVTSDRTAELANAGQPVQPMETGEFDIRKFSICGHDKYIRTFLKKREPVPKRQTYMALPLYEKIAQILAVIASDLSVPVFIDNVLSEHLERYRDRINGIYETKTTNTPL